MSDELYGAYDKLHQKKLDIETELSEIKNEIRNLESKILDKFTNDGVNKVTLPGNVTLWLDHKLWASAGGDTEALIISLEAGGHDDLVKKTVNRNSLSAWVRELAPYKLATPEEVKRELPVELQDRVKITETNNIRVRRS